MIMGVHVWLFFRLKSEVRWGGMGDVGARSPHAGCEQ